MKRGAPWGIAKEKRNRGRNPLPTAYKREGKQGGFPDLGRVKKKPKLKSKARATYLKNTRITPSVKRKDKKPKWGGIIVAGEVGRGK